MTWAFRYFDFKELVKYLSSWTHFVFVAFLIYVFVFIYNSSNINLFLFFLLLPSWEIMHCLFFVTFYLGFLFLSTSLFLCFFDLDLVVLCYFYF